MNRRYWMQWNDHSRDVPEGAHAFFGASNYHWTNYDEEKMEATYRNHLATLEGTEKHAFAAMCITQRRKIQGRDTLAKYVNDAIGFKMDPEVPLYYSDNFFGTTDAINFRNHPDKESEFKYFLRIHDLKTGKVPAKLRQLEVYAAFFFLEYKIKPEETEIELRIYQNDDIVVGNPTVKDIKPIMNKIILFDKRIEKIKLEG